MTVKYLGSHERTNERTNERTRRVSWKFAVGLHGGDCLAVMPSLADGSVNLILADLPFGITDLTWDKRIATSPLWEQYRRLLAPRGCIVLFATQPFATELINAAARWFRYEWIWEKPSPTGFLQAHKMPMRRHENILVFYPKLPRYNPPGLRRCAKPKRVGRMGQKLYRGSWKERWVTRTTGWPQSILRMGKMPFGKREPCEKPLELLSFLIRTYTRPGDLVLDNAMGLGSTGLAALSCGRQFVGIELDHKRYLRAKDRIRRGLAATGEK